MPGALDKALLSLRGLSLGDAFGECFFKPQAVYWLSRRELPPAPWRWTDDTHMALSIVEVLREHGCIEVDALAAAFARRFAEQPHRGYGAGAAHLLGKLIQGADWREEAPRLFHGGSFGNGGAMRAAPIGGYFAGDPARAAGEARKAAMITHHHPEGQAGAMAVAAGAAIAAMDSPPRGRDFLLAVAAYVPPGETREGILHAAEIPAQESRRAARELGTGQRVSAQDTVPYCLWCAAHNLDAYEEALWQTVAGLGDRDTTCAIVGGIVALSAGEVPREWLRRREPLPPEFER